MSNFDGLTVGDRVVIRWPLSLELAVVEAVNKRSIGIKAEHGTSYRATLPSGELAGFAGFARPCIEVFEAARHEPVLREKTARKWWQNFCKSNPSVERIEQIRALVEK